MKKVYEALAVEKVEFQYRDQVVVASPGYQPSLGGEFRSSSGGDNCAYYNQDDTMNCQPAGPSQN